MKNKTKLLFAGILAAFLMLAVPFAVVAFDADDINAENVDINSEYVAMIGESGYDSVQEAIDAAKIGDVVRLIANEEVSNQNSSGIIVGKTKEITLDLNGYSITMLDDATTNKNTQLILNQGNLTIVDSSGSNNGRISTQYTGGETYDPQKQNGCATNTITSEPGSVLTIEGGIIENTTTDNTIAFAIDGRTNGTLGNVTVNIEGGYIVSKKITVRIFANSTTDTGSLNISGGTIEGRVWVQSSNDYQNLASLNITGGTFNTNNYASYVLSAWGNYEKFEASITEGIFNGEVRQVSKSKFISGGTYSNDVSEFCKNGFDVGITALDDDYALSFESGKVTFTENFETDELITIDTNGNLDIFGVEGNSLAGLTVDGNGNDVTISGLMTESAGIVVFDADVVKIQNCNVCSVNEELYQYSHNIFGIRISESNNVTISGNVISDIETITVEGIKYDGVGIGIYKINVSIAINEGNVVSDTGHNSIWIVDSINASVTIEDNEIFNWAIDGEGRAIRIQNVKSTVISDNLFSKDTVSKNLESTVKVDCNLSDEISVTFNGDILSGNTIFIDDGTTYDSLSVDDKSTYYCYDTTIISGNLNAEGDSTFHIAKGGMLSLLSGATINCTINGPGDARITFYDVAAGPGGATLTGGSIIAGGMFTSGSVTIATAGNVLDGTFDDVDITVDDVEVEINDDVVFTNGTTVTLKDGASFSEDPVFEAGTKLTIVTGASTEVIPITETSKVSSSGVVRVGFALPIACENGTVYYEKREVMAITVFEGDSYGQYLAKLGVKADPGYFWNNVFTNEFGASVSSSSIVDEGDKLFATCYAAFSSSEADANEPAGFDIADHVVLIEAVIAVLVLIGFVAYIRKN